jgi:hypothetical protein
MAYRVRQFWDALGANPTPAGLERAAELLNGDQIRLFLQLQPSEQAHALRVMEHLEARGETSPDLLVAALLHDVGKVRCPLRLWERILIVLGRAFFLHKAKTWSEGPPSGLRRAFVIAEKHPIWGAEMALEQGVSLLAANLIRRHQETGPLDSIVLEDQLLAALQAADNKS